MAGQGIDVITCGAQADSQTVPKGETVSPIKKQNQDKPLRKMPVRVAVAALSWLAASAAFAAPLPPGATPSLSFSSSAQVWGSVYTQYSSPFLGDVSFSLNGPSDYQYNPRWDPNTGGQVFAATTGVASASYQIQAGQGGIDPVYDIVTTSGQYGFSYAGQAETSGLRLRTKMEVATVDAAGQAANSPSTNINAYAYAQWNQQFYIGATAARPAGSYGAILVSYTLDGDFTVPDGSAGVWGNAQSWAQAGTSFTDTAGVSYQSNFSVSAASYDPSWTGSTTQYKKLLFQYGTPFSINLYQYAYANQNGTADFFNTGYISSIELPFGATLDSGAQQAGLGSLAQLYGTVTHSATVDDPNTNWDFGNNGGGFTPPVPEPASVLMMLAGLGALGALARRRAA